MNELVLENAKLREQVEGLSARVAYFENMLENLGTNLPPAWRLTRTEARVTDVLLRASGRVVPYDAIIEAVWLGRDPETVQRSLYVHACRIRRKLRPFGMNVLATWGVGFSIGTVEAARV